MLFGRDEMLLEALDAGACGAIGSTYNFMAPLYGRLIDAWSAGDHGAARRLQDQATRVIDVMNGHGGLPAGKRIMALSGLDCGPVRTPLVDLDAATAERLRADLVAAGHVFP